MLLRRGVSGSGFYVLFHPQASILKTLFCPVPAPCQECNLPWFTVFCF